MPTYSQDPQTGKCFPRIITLVILLHELETQEDILAVSHDASSMVKYSLYKLLYGDESKISHKIIFDVSLFS